MPGHLLAPALLGAAFALQPTGTFHEGEPVARHGEHWLALVVDGDRALLEKTRVRIRTVEDGVVDAPGEATGQEVTATDAPDADLLLRGPRLRAGPVEMAKVTHGHVQDGPPGSAPEGPIATIEFRGAVYRIEARCADGPVPPDAAQRCDIVLARGLASQTLQSLERVRLDDGSVEWVGSASPALLRAGDFDRDGRLDLIFDTTDHYNASNPTLFLSSQAGPRELVRPVAEYRSTGC